MPTHSVRYSSLRVLSLSGSCLLAVACVDPHFQCPDGFALAGDGRCLPVDAGVPSHTDGAPPPSDAGSSDTGIDAHASLDATVSMVDAGIPMMADAFVGPPDAYVVPPDAYVVPPDAYVVPPDACAWGTWYADADHDGYGGPPLSACAQPAGSVANSTDCNDTNAAIHPGATEACNGVDDNCNGQIDEGVTPTFYRDADGDMHGDPTMPVTTYCTAPLHYVLTNDDCNDTNAAIHPGATEVCNGVDDNCNGQIDEGVHPTFYLDRDGDGYGDSSTASATYCVAPLGYVSVGGDCDDRSASTNPGAIEICNAVDDNCNGMIDEGVQTIYYVDCDGDGYAMANASYVPGCSSPTTPPPPTLCAQSGWYLHPAQWITRVPSDASTTDCRDTNAWAYPGSTHWDSRPYITESAMYSWDFNCDGRDTQQITVVSHVSATCSSSGLGSCSVSNTSWAGDPGLSAPGCGATAALNTCASSTLTTCGPVTAMRAQTCN